ncbi:hypothetical protein E2C01_037392 [Portunus trituberculatus]|uniref:Uncharacterized protein n=1 Tax=Portunus trituberculatus TaxID=210409 RepID=A0A5B7F988_PORTR|nr:hypothetical protein [Portunus trituberculatus]
MSLRTLWHQLNKMHTYCSLISEIGPVGTHTAPAFIFCF